MVKYLVIFGYFSEVVEVEDETTDYQSIVDILIDRLEEQGCEGCFINWINDGSINEDEFIVGGNHGRLLYHGGNFRIEEMTD